MLRVKICGIAQPDAAEAIARLGATDLGFICVPSSPRYVAPEQIQAIAAHLTVKVNRIGVFVNASSEEIASVAAIAPLTGIQLHGSESPAYCRQLRQLLPEMEIIKALRIAAPADLDLAATYINSIDTLLLDAYHPQLHGGTGKTLDWQALANFRPPIPWLLAGGLTPDNVLTALSQAHPDGIDLSSGVERAPGDKDLDKVKQLFAKL